MTTSVESAELAGTVALVTGAARGIGRAIAVALADRGASVVATDVLAEELARTQQLLGDRGITVIHDVTSEQSWAEVVEAAEKHYGAVGILINNAGVIRWNVPIRDLTLVEYRRVIEVNQIGTFLGMKSVLSSMQGAGGGSIVNMSSTAGLIGYWGLAAYVASKWAVRGMTKTAAIEFGPLGIRVNSVHPGNVRTDMTAGLPEPLDEPLGRSATTEELARHVCFLAGSQSSFMTGAELVADGGHTVGKTVLESP